MCRILRPEQRQVARCAPWNRQPTASNESKLTMTALPKVDRVLALLLCAAILAATGCRDDTSPAPPPPPPADEMPPVVTITFPVTVQEPFPQTEYDETGDGLLDLQVEWTDDDSGVDPSTATVWVLEGVNGSAGSGRRPTGAVGRREPGRVGSDRPRGP